MLDDEAGVGIFFAPPMRSWSVFQRLAVRRVREHEVELAAGEGVVRERRALGPAHDVVGGRALALENQVGLGDRVGLGVDLLAVQVRRDLWPRLP